MHPLFIYYILSLLRLLFSHVPLSATLWTIARQAPLSPIISQNWLKFMSIELVMLANHLCQPILLLPSIFPASGSFPVSQLFISSDQSTRTSTSASVLPMNLQGWLPLGRTGLISLQPEELSRVFSSTTACRISESQSRSVMSDSLRPHGLCSPWKSPGQNTGVGIFTLLQGIFPT